MKVIFFASLALFPLVSEATECRLPEAPASFLEMATHDRHVKFVESEPKRPHFLNLPDSRFPNLLSNCRVTPVNITGDDPISHQPRAVTAMSYAPNGSNPAALRTVVLLPPTGGENALDDAYADKLCNDGIRVVLVVHWENDNPTDIDLDVHDRSALRATAAAEDVIEYIQPRGKNQLGILGTSVGAIQSSLVLGIDSRVTAATLIVGGGGMPEIIGRSTEEHLTELRKERLADPSLHLADEDAYVKALGDHVKIEPLTFVKFAKPKDVLFFEGTKDITVPTANQELLWQALGNPEKITHDSDHIHTILFTSATQKGRISEFFQGSLVPPNAEELAAPAAAPSGNKLCRNAREMAPVSVVEGIEGSGSQGEPISAE